MKRTVYETQAKKTLEYFEKAHIVLTDEEKASIEVSDFGLNDVENIGLQLVVYVNTDKVCAKEMVLFPGQTCPEHRHIPSYGMPGKEETFRCRYGEAYLYVEGDGKKEDIKAKIQDTTLTVFHEVILKAGEQYTILPGTQHWFQGGPDGAIVSEFSTHSTDETDIFIDERISRIPVVED